MSDTSQKDDIILRHFIAKFEEYDELSFSPAIDPIAAEFISAEANLATRHTWRPMRLDMDPVELDGIYAKLPARFPKLFERLVLSYRWAEVHLDTFTLFPNHAKSGLSGWLRETSRDKFLWDFLIRSGFIPFAKGPDMDYDRVCFDIGARKKSGDYRIVKIDHEAALCNSRLKIVAELSPTFRDLVQQTIAHKPARRWS